MSEDQQGLQIPEGYWVLGNPEQRRVLKRRGVDMVRQAEDAGMVIFLDKTARPLGDLFRAVFPIVYPDRKLPKIRFTNIGGEKSGPIYGKAWHEHALEREANPDAPLKPPPKFEDSILSIETKVDLEELYGDYNIEQLVKVLGQTKSPEKRLIVDEVDYLGHTKVLAEKILGIIDPINTYSSFTLLESDEDKEKFKYTGRDAFKRKGLVRASVPWHGYSVLQMEDPEYDYSFTLSGVFDKTGRDVVMKLKDEFRMLADEIKQERLPA